MGTTTTSKYNDDDDDNDNNDGDYNDSTNSDSGNHSNWKDIGWTQHTIITSTTSRDIHEKQYSDRAKTNKCNTQYYPLSLIGSIEAMYSQVLQWKQSIMFMRDKYGAKWRRLLFGKKVDSHEPATRVLEYYDLLDYIKALASSWSYYAPFFDERSETRWTIPSCDDCLALSPWQILLVWLLSFLRPSSILVDFYTSCTNKNRNEYPTEELQNFNFVFD